MVDSSLAFRTHTAKFSARVHHVKCLIVVLDLKGFQMASSSLIVLICVVLWRGSLGQKFNVSQGQGETIEGVPRKQILSG